MCSYNILKPRAWLLELGNHGMDYCLEQHILIVGLAAALPFGCSQQNLIPWFIEIWLWDQDQALYGNKDL